MATIGRYVPNPPDAGIGFGAAGEMRASKAAAPSTPLWVEAIGVRAGRRSGGGNVTGTLACYEVLGSGAIGNLLGRTSEFTISAVMEDNAGGDWYEVTVQDPFLVSGPVAVAFLGEGNGYGLGQDNSGAIMYVKTGQSAPPSSWGSSSSSPQGTISVALVGETNVKPDKPSGRSPSSSTSDFTPTFTFLFRDDNEALSGHAIGEADELKAIRIQVKQGGVLVWNYERAATSGEKSARQATQEYASSTALVAGEFDWQCAVQDAAGAWSDWSGWLTVDLGSGGRATMVSPSGVITDDTPDFVVHYVHDSGTASTHIQLHLTQSGVEVQLGTKIARVVASGADTTITWAQSGFSALTLGDAYRVEAKAFVGAAESEWDEGLRFDLDSRPNTPAFRSPNSGGIYTTRPTLRFLTTDQNDLPPALGGEVEIVDMADVLVGIRTATWNATLNRFEYPTTAADFPTTGVSRKWRARGVDPVGPGPWSSQMVVTYAAGPTPVITSPTEGQVIATNTVTITYTAAGQVRRRGRVFEAATDTLVYDTTEETTASLSFSVPSGPLLDAVGAYYATVEVWDSLNINGTSPPRSFVIDVPSPAAVANFTVEATTARFDPPFAPSIVRMTWTPTTDPDFEEYRPWRKPIGAPDSAREILAHISSATIGEFLDTTPLSGVDYEYGLEYSIMVGLERITSLPATGQARVDLLYTIISDVVGGEERRIVLRYWKERKVKPTDNRVIVPSWSGKPVQVGDATDYDVISGTWQVKDEEDTGIPSRTLVEEARALRRVREDLTPTVVCYRDPRPRLLFGVVQVEENDGRAVPSELPIVVTEVKWAGVA